MYQLGDLRKIQSILDDKVMIDVCANGHPETRFCIFFEGSEASFSRSNIFIKVWGSSFIWTVVLKFNWQV